MTWNYSLKVTTKNGIADQIPTVRHANRFRWWRCSNVPPDWWLILWWTKRMAWKPRPLSDNRWLFFRLWHPWCCSWSSSWRREIFMTLWHSWEDASLVYFSLPRASVVAFSRGWHMHAFADCDFDCIYLKNQVIHKFLLNGVLILKLVCRPLSPYSTLIYHFEQKLEFEHFSGSFQGSSHHIHIVHIPLSNLSSFWVQHIPEWVCLVCAAQRLSLLEEGLALADLGWGSGARRRFAVIFFTFHSLIFWTRGLCTNCGFHFDDFWCI